MITATAGRSPQAGIRSRLGWSDKVAREEEDREKMFIFEPSSCLLVWNSSAELETQLGISIFPKSICCETPVVRTRRSLASLLLKACWQWGRTVQGRTEVCWCPCLCVLQLPAVYITCKWDLTKECPLSTAITNLKTVNSYENLKSSTVEIHNFNYCFEEEFEH